MFSDADLMGGEFIGLVDIPEWFDRWWDFGVEILFEGFKIRTIFIEADLGLDFATSAENGIPVLGLVFLGHEIWLAAFSEVGSDVRSRNGRPELNPRSQAHKEL